MRKPIVVVGSINLDLVSKGKRIPAPGETLLGESFHTFHGGKGANQAVAVARLGHPIAMIGKVGHDEFGARLRESLACEGIDVTHVGYAPGVSSGVAMISVDEAGQNSITVVPGANAMLTPADLDVACDVLRSAAMILAQLEIPLETVEHLCALARKFGVPVMLDPAPARALEPEIVAQVAYLTPNESETCTLCGISDPDLDESKAAECAARLKRMGADNVIIKMGGRGALVLAADGTQTVIAGFKVPVVDSTAAGDAFNGALATALSGGLSLPEAVRYASAAGAVSVTRAGAQPAMPPRQEVERLLGGADPFTTTDPEPEVVEIEG